MHLTAYIESCCDQPRSTNPPLVVVGDAVIFVRGRTLARAVPTRANPYTCEGLRDSWANARYRPTNCEQK
ncbi:hypothetical protein AWB75_03222 [Caballeronia catudaia]|uniref:Uncharacterized protein n=1 Tax=Caballeronia catudaia TaxID=1777136 RepID=A0A158BBM0_9BURK|nr:hypothetical protein AWB75_03222 [Caballeronia catudaia]